MDEWAIASFRGDYRFLSNFYPSPLDFNGISFPTVEHAYQAGKSLDPEFWDTMARIETPGEAKKLGQTVELRDNWETVKVPLMTMLVRKKFNSGLRYRLLLTRDRMLVEGNTWHDLFWGMCVCPTHSTSGRNELGKILMQIREELRC